MEREEGYFPRGAMADASVTIERYFELLKESKVRGYLFAQQNYIPKES